MPDPTLVIIARAPEAGRVKSRLAAGIGTVAALAVYECLLSVVATAQRGWPGMVLLAATGSPEAWARTPLADLPRREQPTGGLGARIAAALHWGLAHGGPAVAIGTDCPGLRPQHLARLAALVEQTPVAFGPAEDGGYWGVAVAETRAVPPLTGDDLPWSSPDLLAASEARLAAAGLTAARGDVLADCDDADDLAAAVAAGYLAWPQPALEIRR
jgi:rSAM/selenodomain-associated transferase 1